MKVVVDTSPVIFLSKINATHLLKDCFDKAWVPTAVVNELGDLALPSFIEQKPISTQGRAFVEGALGRLHRGELEAMVLAQEIHADFVVMDDLSARRKARRLGLRTIGTVGVLLVAHKQERLSPEEAIGHISALTEKHNLYLSQRVLDSLTEILGGTSS